MPRIIWEGAPYGEWDPVKGEILLPWDPEYKEKTPIIFAHELGHLKLQHGLGDNNLSRIVEERDAWRYALSKLPPEEIDLDFLDSVWNIEEIKLAGASGGVVEFARKCKNEIMALARKKKGVL